MNLDTCMPWVCRRLAFHEGVVFKPYRDTVGKLTIGVGRNLDDNPLTAEEQKACGDIYQGITRNAAYMLLRNDVTRCESELRSHIKFYTQLDVERQYALLDLCFNFSLAAYECMNSNYGKQLPNRAKRIAYLIRTGEWQRN